VRCAVSDISKNQKNQQKKRIRVGNRESYVHESKDKPGKKDHLNEVRGGRGQEFKTRKEQKKKIKPGCVRCGGKTGGPVGSWRVKLGRQCRN